MIAWQTLLGNLSSVGLFISVWMHLSYRHYRLTKKQLQVGFGVTIGVCIIASMIQSVALVEGIFFDLRVSLLVVSGIFGGPLSLGVSALLAVVARIAIGGAGMVPGLYGLFVVSSIVLALRLLSGKFFKRLPGLFGLATIAAVLSQFVLLLLPKGLLEAALATVALPIALVNFVATLASGLVMIYFSKFTQERDILRAALTQAPDFHYVKDRDSRFVVTNLNVARHNGRQKSSEMVGLSDFDICPDRAGELFEVEQRLMATGQPLTDHEERIQAPDGSERWYTTSKVVLRNRHGDLVGLSGVTRDITLRKKLENDLVASRNLLSQAMAEMSDGLAMFDPHGFLVFCNDQYRAAFPRSAYARKEGAHIRDIVRAVVRNGERKDISIDAEERYIEAAASTLHTDKDENPAV
ncbi:PAS domain S-box-containing protein [Shinella sp. BE166]|uniref:PAS domain-containing protein n=1 Tax=Shinella sp. BE166 TaxID=3373918 RepID=UPI003EBDBC5B